MITCTNCDEKAHYTYRVNEDEMIHFCSRHVPKFLNEAKRLGLLALYVPPKSPKKKAETVIEEPMVEDPVIEDVVEEVTPEEE